jgi:hypothetical protein
MEYFGGSGAQKDPINASIGRPRVGVARNDKKANRSCFGQQKQREDALTLGDEHLQSEG